MNTTKEITLIIMGFIVIIGIAIGLIWFRSSQEAKSYRKFCDTPVETWDALWLDLRIDECSRIKNL